MGDWIARAVGETTFEQLAEGLGGSELQSLLLEVMARRAAARTPADVLGQYKRDKFVQASALDQRVSLELDAHLLAAAEGFEAIELSPVTPLGTCSTMGPTHQHRTLSALRGTEVVSDPTNVMALVCAERVQRSTADVHLATTMRVVRAQPVPNVPGFTQHFRLFAMASAGRETEQHGWTVAALVRHVQTMQRALDRLEQHGYAFGARRVDVRARPDREEPAKRVAAELGATLKPLVQPYYSGGIRYMLWVTAPDGQEVPLIDGGAFDWLAKLTANRRHAFVASGGGAQLVQLRFKR